MEYKEFLYYFYFIRVKVADGIDFKVKDVSGKSNHINKHLTVELKKLLGCHPLL